MIFIDSTYHDFVKKTAEKKVIIFGASSLWHYYLKIFPDFGAEVGKRTLFVVDNDLAKQGTCSEIAGRLIEIKKTDELLKQDNFVILIAVSMAYQVEICDQLISMELAEETECYSLPLMIYGKNKADNSCVEPYFSLHGDKQIPAKIHSFWFSREKKPDIYKKCIESWHKYCPDFEIIEWNSDTYDISKNRYMKQAYESRKWAFVSDYARLDVILEHGGIYLDMDVELTAPIDRLRNATAFFCRQEDGFVELGSGFGAMSGNRLIKEMLDVYRGAEFVDSRGVMDITPQPERLSRVLERNNIRICHDSQVINDMIFLSNEYIVCDFRPETMGRLESKLGIHWHNAGWHNEKDKYVIKKSIEARPALLERYFK